MKPAESEDLEWTPCRPWFPKTLINGERSGSDVPILMEARQNGKLIYRRPTPEEVRTYNDCEAW